MAKQLDSGALSAFCDGIAMMLGAGIQTDEAVQLLAENMEPSPFKKVCDEVYLNLIEGKSLAVSMEATGAFPDYALSMVQAGEVSGRLENTLKSLSIYYNEEDRLFIKMSSAILYPTALLAVMTVILIFTDLVVLPVFVDVYNNISGELYAGSYAYVNVSLGIGWIALIIMGICTVIALFAVVLSRGSGRHKLLKVMESVPVSSDSMYHMALSRFTAALATFVSAGMSSDVAMEGALKMIDNKKLQAKAEATYESMISLHNPKSLSQAIYDSELFDPIYARMMLVGDRSGSVEQTLQNLSNTFFEDAVVRIDSLIDSVEPTLAAFLTVSVGATLIAVMLPLVGIMGSIG